MWYVVTFTGEGFREEMDFAGDTEDQAKERALDYMQKENANPNRKEPKITGFTIETLNPAPDYKEIDKIDGLYDLYDRLLEARNKDDTAAVQWALLTIEAERRRKRDEIDIDQVKARLYAIRKMLKEKDNDKILDMCKARDYHLYGTTEEFKIMLAEDMIRDIMDDLTPL